MLSLFKLGVEESRMSSSEWKTLSQDFQDLNMIIRQHHGSDTADNFSLAMRIILAERQLNNGQTLQCLRTIGNDAEKSSTSELAEAWDLSDPAQLQILAFARQGDYAIAAFKLLASPQRCLQFASHWPATAWEIARHSQDSRLVECLQNKEISLIYPASSELLLQRLMSESDSNAIRRILIELLNTATPLTIGKAWLAAVTKSPSLCSDPVSNRVFRALGSVEDKKHDSTKFVLRNLYSASTSVETMQERMAKINESLRVISVHESFEMQTLTSALSARILLIFNQLDLAAHHLSSYRSMCRRITNDSSSDILNCFASTDTQQILSRVTIHGNREADPVLTDRDSKISVKELAALFLDVGRLMSKGSIAKTLIPGATKKKIEINTQLEMAQVVSRYLRKRRGAIVKIGQLTSHFSGTIAERMREEFEILRTETKRMTAAHLDLHRLIFGCMDRFLLAFPELQNISADKSSTGSLGR